MWGTFLSEPLLIVDLVSRYLTNYLIRRMTISHRISTFNIVSCDTLFYAVLILLSEGYPPV